MFLLILNIRLKSTPEQLQWSEHYDKVKRLHVEGKSDQAEEGKHSHWEVKSEKQRKDFH